MDLNRNFDSNWEAVHEGYGLVSSDPDAATYRGPRPESEPETKAVVAFVGETKPLILFSYHWLGSIAGTDFFAPKSVENDEAFVRIAQPLITAYTRGFFGAEQPPEARPHFWATPGSFPEWAYKKHGIPCFDVEASRKRPIEEAGATDRATPEMLREYQERHYRGIRAVVQELAR